MVIFYCHMALTKIKHPESDVTTQILKIIFQVFPDPWFFKLEKKQKQKTVLIRMASHVLCDTVSGK